MKYLKMLIKFFASFFSKKEAFNPAPLVAKSAELVSPLASNVSRSERRRALRAVNYPTFSRRLKSIQRYSRLGVEVKYHHFSKGFPGLKDGTLIRYPLFLKEGDLLRSAFRVAYTKN